MPTRDRLHGGERTIIRVLHSQWIQSRCSERPVQCILATGDLKGITLLDDRRNLSGRPSASFRCSRTGGGGDSSAALTMSEVVRASM